MVTERSAAGIAARCLVLVAAAEISLWGGLRMAIDPSSVEVSLHEPVVARVVLMNSTVVSVPVDFGADFVEEFRITVRGPDGQRRAVPPLRRVGLAPGGEVTIAGNSNYATRLVLNEWCQFDIPGEYTLELSLPGVSDVGIIRVTILPRDAQRLGSVYEKLAQEALDAQSFDDARIYAVALSFAFAPEAAPHLRRIAETRDGLASVALRGLERIGDRSAVTALEILSHSPNNELKLMARGSLGMIRISTKDDALKREIEAILADTR